MAKLELIRQLDLPTDLFSHALPHELERYRQRIAVEAPYEMRRHPEANRLTWLAAFAHLRGAASFCLVSGPRIPVMRALTGEVALNLRAI